MTTTHWSIRQTDRRVAQVARLGEITGLDEDFTAIVDFALATTLAHYGAKENEMNERRWDRMARGLDEVVANAETVEDVTEALFELGWSKDDVDAALDDPNFPNLPTR